MKYIILPDGRSMPKLGQGTWMMAETLHKRNNEIEALKKGIENEMTLIDTAEMYGEGASEILISQAIKDVRREELFIVSKVYPHNAGKERIFNSCENSLKRLGTDYLDLYLLHWRGRVPLRETVACMEELKKQEKIKGWGVSNFDLADMEELYALPEGKNCQTNQVLYHLASRGIEYDLLPWMEANEIPVMAYCPIAQGGDLRRGLYNNPGVIKIAEKYGITVTQLLLAFVMRMESVAAIPKAGSPAHVIENSHSIKIQLLAEDIAALDSLYPAPSRKMPLDIV